MTISKCPLCGTVNNHDHSKVVAVTIDGRRRYVCIEHTMAGADPVKTSYKEAAE